MRIFVISKKEDFSEIGKFLKILSPNAPVDFVEQKNLEKIKNVGGTGETFLFYNYEDENLREAVRGLEFSASGGKKIGLGFSNDADFFVSDENITEEEINFKLNYKGSSVPIWLKSQNKEDIINCLTAISVAIVLGANMVEVSEKLKAM